MARYNCPCVSCFVAIHCLYIIYSIALCLLLFSIYYSLGHCINLIIYFLLEVYSFTFHVLVFITFVSSYCFIFLIILCCFCFVVTFIFVLFVVFCFIQIISLFIVLFLFFIFFSSIYGFILFLICIFIFNFNCLLLFFLIINLLFCTWSCYVCVMFRSIVAIINFPIMAEEWWMSDCYDLLVLILCMSN